MSYPDGCYHTEQFLSGAQEEPQQQRANKRLVGRYTSANPSQSKLYLLQVKVGPTLSVDFYQQGPLKPWLVWIVVEAAKTHIV